MAELTGFPPNSFSDVVGPIIISAVFSMLLFGIILTKAIEYFNRFWGRDGWTLKAAVAGCLFGALLDSASIVGWAYLWGSIHWGDPTIFAHFPLYQQLQGVGVGITTFSAQLFFAWRIFIVQERSVWISGFIAILSMAQLAFVVWITVNTVMFPSVTYDPASKPNMLHAWISMNLAADSLITGALIWTLVIKVWRRGGGDRSPSHSNLRSIVLRTFEFNFMSLVMQIILTCMTARRSVNFWFELPATLICKIYTLSVIISLTSRSETRFSNDLNLSKYTVDGETPSKRRQLPSNTVDLDNTWAVEEERHQYVASPVAVYFRNGTVWDELRDEPHARRVEKADHGN